MAEIVGGFLMPHNPALSGILAGLARSGAGEKR